MQEYSQRDNLYTIRDQMELIPVSGESIVVAAPGLLELTIPDTAKHATIASPEPVRLTFGETVATAALGMYYAANVNVTLSNRDQLEGASVFCTAACTVYVQYFK